MYPTGYLWQHSITWEVRLNIQLLTWETRDMELHFYDDIKSMKLYALKRNKYKPMIHCLLVNNPIFLAREIEKVIFFKIFWHILLLLTIEELTLVILTSQKTFKFICSLSSALIEISVWVQLSFKIFTPSSQIKV